MSAPKILSVDQIRGMGILQEVNRTFFHPLGLALGIDMADGTIHIDDYLDDPEGVIFAEGVMSAEKCRLFYAMRKERYALRLQALGYIYQPAADPEASKEGAE